MMGRGLPCIRKVLHLAPAFAPRTGLGREERSLFLVCQQPLGRHLFVQYCTGGGQRKLALLDGGGGRVRRSRRKGGHGRLIGAWGCLYAPMPTCLHAPLPCLPLPPSSPLQAKLLAGQLGNWATGLTWSLPWASLGSCIDQFSEHRPPFLSLAVCATTKRESKGWGRMDEWMEWMEWRLVMLVRNARMTENNQPRCTHS